MVPGNVITRYYCAMFDDGPWHQHWRTYTHWKNENHWSLQLNNQKPLMAQSTEPQQKLSFPPNYRTDSRLNVIETSLYNCDSSGVKKGNLCPLNRGCRLKKERQLKVSKHWVIGIRFLWGEKVKMALQAFIACFLTIAMVTRGDYQKYYLMARFWSRFLTRCSLPNFKKHTDPDCFC